MVDDLYFPAPVITRFVSEAGTDTDVCGETAKTPCQTISRILAQLLDRQIDIPSDLKIRVDKVWNKAIDDVAFMLSKQEYPGPDNDYRKLL